MATKSSKSNNEIYELVEDLRRDVDATYLRIKQYESDIQPVKKDLDQINQSIKWITLLVLGGVITAVLNLITRATP
jgi:hypothetical protein